MSNEIDLLGQQGFQPIDPPTTPDDPSDEVVIDYFGFGGTRKFLLTGGQFIEYKKMNEGARKRYQNRVNREVKVQKATGDAIMKMASGDERHVLLQEAICDWRLLRGGQEVPFSRANLDQWLEVADPLLVDKLEKAVRDENPWLLADVSLEDLYNQREEIDRQIDEKRKEQEGKGF